MSHEEKIKKLPTEEIRKLTPGGEPTGGPHNETQSNSQLKKLTQGGEPTGGPLNETPSNSKREE